MAAEEPGATNWYPWARNALHGPDSIDTECFQHFLQCVLCRLHQRQPGLSRPALCLQYRFKVVKRIEEIGKFACVGCQDVWFQLPYDGIHNIRELSDLLGERDLVLVFEVVDLFKCTGLLQYAACRAWAYWIYGPLWRSKSRASFQSKTVLFSGEILTISYLTRCKGNGTGNACPDVLVQFGSPDGYF